MVLLFCRIIIVSLTVFALLVVMFRIGVLEPVFGYSDHATEINEMISNLSYSYLAGLIFYLFNNGVPTLVRLLRAWLLMRKDISAFANNFYCFLGTSLISHEVKPDLKEISLNDLVHKNMRGELWYKINQSGAETKIVFDENASTIANYQTQSQQQLKQLIQNPEFGNLPHSLVNVMAKIYADDYFNGLNCNISDILVTIKMYRTLINTIWVSKPCVKISVPTSEEKMKYEASTII